MSESPPFKIDPGPDQTRTLVWPEVWVPGTRYVVVRSSPGEYRLEIDTRPLAEEE